MVNSDPVFPITVTFLEDGDKWILNNESELASNLEWFDSRDPDENAEIVDQLNRHVRVKVEKLVLIEFFIEEK